MTALLSLLEGKNPYPKIGEVAAIFTSRDGIPPGKFDIYRTPVRDVTQMQYYCYRVALRGHVNLT